MKILSLVFFLISSTCYGFSHPGVLVSQSQLDFMKQQTLAGVEPFASTYTKAKASTWGSLTYAVQGPPSGGTINCGSYSNPNIGCTLEDNDSTAALTQALLWYISGNQTYANNAIKIMNAYSKGLTGGHTNSNATVQAGWATQNFPAAAEIIRYSGAGWADADFAAFKSLMVNSYLPNLADSGLTNKNGNWGMGALSGRLGIAVLSDNQSLFDSTVAEFNQAVPAYFYNAVDGSAPVTNPIISSKWNGQTVFNATVNGVCQETCRDLQHMQFGMAWTFNFMETAYIQGNDLYTPLQFRMVPVLELHAALFPAGFSDLSPGGTKEPSPASICGGTVTAVLNPTYEIAYNAYHNRMGVALPNTLAQLANVRAIPFTGGNAALNHGMTFESLHHGGSPGNVPSPSPTPTPVPTGTPIPTPTPAPSSLSCTAKVKKSGARIDVTFSTAPAQFEVNDVVCQ
jgi:hypothetical protein